MMDINKQLSIGEAKLELAKTHDARMRELERTHTATWSEMAEIATLVDHNHEWECLGFHSFGAWLVDAAPQSRSAMYAGMGLLKELKDDVSKKDLRQIPLSTAKVMMKLPRKMRKNPEVLRKAKTVEPRNFVKHIRETAPELHIEKRIGRKYEFDESQGKAIDAAVEMYRLIEDDPDATEEQCLEGIAADYLLSHKDKFEEIFGEVEKRKSRPKPKAKSKGAGR